MTCISGDYSSFAEVMGHLLSVTLSVIHGQYLIVRKINWTKFHHKDSISADSLI